MVLTELLIFPNKQLLSSSTCWGGQKHTRSCEGRTQDFRLATAVRAHDAGRHAQKKCTCRYICTAAVFFGYSIDFTKWFGDKTQLQLLECTLCKRELKSSNLFYLNGEHSLNQW